MDIPKIWQKEKVENYYYNEAAAEPKQSWELIFLYNFLHKLYKGNECKLCRKEILSSSKEL